MAAKHGWGKLIKLTSGDEIEMLGYGGFMGKFLMSLAVFGELVCGALLVLGLFTRFAALAYTITMIVAVLGAHSDSIFGDGEHALLFFGAGAALFFTGPGKFSIDRGLFK